MQYVRTDVVTESYIYVRSEECDGLARIHRRDVALSVIQGMRQKK